MKQFLRESETVLLTFVICLVKSFSSQEVHKVLAYNDVRPEFKAQTRHHQRRKLKIKYLFRRLSLSRFMAKALSI